MTRLYWFTRRTSPPACWPTTRLVPHRRDPSILLGTTSGGSCFTTDDCLTGTVFSFDLRSLAVSTLLTLYNQALGPQSHNPGTLINGREADTFYFTLPPDFSATNGCGRNDWRCGLLYQAVIPLDGAAQLTVLWQFNYSSKLVNPRDTLTFVQGENGGDQLLGTVNWSSEDPLFVYHLSSRTMTSSWQTTAATTGIYPVGLAADDAGNVVGVTAVGGKALNGTIFVLRSDNSLQVAATFGRGGSIDGAVGMLPSTGAVLGKDGYWYAGTSSGMDGRGLTGSLFRFHLDVDTDAVSNVEAVKVLNFTTEATLSPPLFASTTDNAIIASTSPPDSQWWTVTSGVFRSYQQRNGSEGEVWESLLSSTNHLAKYGATVQNPITGDLYGVDLYRSLIWTTNSTGLSYRTVYTLPRSAGYTFTGGLTWCNGSLFGTVGMGTNYSFVGGVFSLTTLGVFTLLRDFSKADGSYVSAVLVDGMDGWLYGRTLRGATTATAGRCRSFGCGTLFRVQPQGRFELIANLTVDSPGDGRMDSVLIRHSDGNLLYLQSRGGVAGMGAVMRVCLTLCIVSQPRGSVWVRQYGNLTLTTRAQQAASLSGLPLTCQWQRKAMTENGWSDIAGATNPSLSLPFIPLTDNSVSYRVQYSLTTSIRVTSDISTVWTASAPTILSSPPSIAPLRPGETATLCSSAVAFPDYPSPQWQLSEDAGTSWLDRHSLMKVATVFHKVNNSAQTCLTVQEGKNGAGWYRVQWTTWVGSVGTAGVLVRPLSSSSSSTGGVDYSSSGGGGGGGSSGTDSTGDTVRSSTADSSSGGGGGGTHDSSSNPLLLIAVILVVVVIVAFAAVAAVILLRRRRQQRSASGDGYLAMQEPVTTSDM